MRLVLSAAALLAVCTVATFAQELPAATQQQVEAIAQKVLKDTGVPSASVAIAENGKVVYAHSFGLANVQPPRPSVPLIAYPIGSVSKQFTAAAILLLQQQGKLSVDDPVAKYFPKFTRANDVKLRNLLTMTSGYEDYAPQDYIIPAWMHEVSPLKNVTEWATKPLDFEPGSEWQYSNTNYVILGLIVEKVSGKPLMQFLRENIFTPLQLKGVFNTYREREKLEVTGYVSHALAPVRVQPLEAAGWYDGDGDLAMPPSTLAEWDLSFAKKSLLSPESYKMMETAFTFTSGKPSNYGFGVFTRTLNGHRALEHSGEVGGYVAENIAFPDDGAAIVVLTNEVASSAAGSIAHGILPLLFPDSAKPVAASGDTLVSTLRTLLPELQQAKIDRSALTSNAAYYFTPETLSDFQSTLAPLGALKSVKLLRSAQRGGMTFGAYSAEFEKGTVHLSTYLTKDGKIEQLLVVGKE
ncbi:MAG: serine hydrolase [Acidobacteriaceae bacterium]|nr:serine hydrolase [Acidobacteriaceae bacterium]